MQMRDRRAMRLLVANAVLTTLRDVFRRFRGYRRRMLKFSGWQICTVLAFLATVQI